MVKEPIKLLTLSEFCKNQGISLTKTTENRQKIVKRKLEHRFWVDGIEKILLGYKEDEFIDKFIKFVSELSDPEYDDTNLANLERTLIFSKHLEQNNISRLWQNFMKKYLNALREAGDKPSIKD